MLGAISETLLVFTVLASVCYGVYRVFTSLGKKIEQRLEKALFKLADQFGLDISFSKEPLSFSDWLPPILSGTVNGFNTKIEVTESGHGDDNNKFFSATIQIKNPQSFHLELYRNSIGTRTLFGQTDLDLGDKKFHDAFLFRSAKKEFVPKVLDAGVRTICLDLKKCFYGVSIKLRGETITFSQYAMPQKKQMKNFKNVIQLMLLLAEKTDAL